ncbi:MAG: NAD-binding protein [Firmicutes bacterium]|nr:NAD-binding protein [Bacillota bacterium]
MKVIVIAGGKVLFPLAEAILSKGFEVCAVNRDPRVCAAIEKRYKVTTVAGDESSPDTLERAGAREAGLLIAVTPWDNLNLVCCKIAKDYFNIPETVTTVNNPDNLSVFKQLGVDHVFDKTEMIVSLLEKSVESFYVKPLVEYMGGKILIYEITITAKMPVVDTEIGKMEFPEHARITGVLRNDEFVVAHPRLIIKAGDKLLLASSEDDLGHAIRALCGDVA